MTTGLRSILVWMAVAAAAVSGGLSLLTPPLPGWMMALCVFLSCALVVGVQGWRIRHVARDLERQEETQYLSKIPEDRLPAEVLPLVRAINRRIERLAALGERQSFFLSAAAHEMRTPLTVVRTRLEQLEDSAIKDRLVTDVRRLTRLVNDLLTLMSIRGRERVMKPVDLVERCGRVIDALDTVAAARAVKLKLETRADPLPVTGDAGLIEVAVTNLVQNAIAHSPIGGVVTIAIDRGPSITVSDQGSGVPEAQQAALFDPFFRLSSGPGGYGLGLTIVRAITDVHGATIRVGNRTDGGGMFVFDFG